jgi:hypothetical protein
MKKMNRCRAYKKGGYIKKIGDRHYFDTGGATSAATTPTGTPPQNALTGQNTLSNGQGGVPGASGITGTVSNALGTNDNYQAGAANITPGTNVGQLNTAYQGAQTGLTNQNNLVNTLTPQAATAVNNQNAVAQQQLGIMNGTGPNPAQAALNQNTAQNIAQQAALNASIRGAGSNAGLAALNNAQVGAAQQQTAVGQEATNAANQQIAAAQNLENLANNQVNQTGQAITNQNTTQQGEQGILQNANTAVNNANVGMQSNINNVNSTTALANQKQNSGLLGSIGSAVSSVAGFLGLASGGQIHMASGGSMPEAPVNEGTFTPSNYSGGTALNVPSSNFTQTVQQVMGGGGSAPAPTGGQMVSGGAADSTAGGAGPGWSPDAGASAIDPGALTMNAAKGGVAHGMVEAMVSPGERYLNKEDVRKVVEDGANPMKLGKVYGGKAKVKGDSLENDVIPDKLEEGGVVIPRHVETKKDRHKSELFVRRAIHMKKPAHEGL